MKISYATALRCGAAALALSSLAGTALAQSTASQLEEIVVTGVRTATVGGLIQAEQLGKTRSTITEEFIQKQLAGQTVLQSINLLPGVNFTNNDPYGSSGGNIRIRSFDNARISLTFDGIPLNDTGNYAIFSNQLLDPEIITRTNVNLGTTDVDSPTASATGGTVNFVTRKPYDVPTLTFQPSVGSFAYKRLFAVVDTGKFDTGTSAFLAGSWTKYNKFKGPGGLEKKQVNGRVYQDFGGGDFISFAGHYNVNRNNFYRNPTLAQYQQLGEEFEQNPILVRSTPGAGTAQNDGTGAFTAGNDFYGLRINPSNTANIRVQSSFGLSDQLRVTFDPYLQYTLANGGGTLLLPENDQRLRGASNGPGVDLNGDGDLLDTIRLYSPNTTNTFRPGVTTSLIYDITEEHRVRMSYTWDHGLHRQTGEPQRLNDDGVQSVWGGKYRNGIITNDGIIFETRNRFSVAELNQLSLEYSGKLLDDALRVNVGVRAPWFVRHLNNQCYMIQTLPTASGTLNSNQYCTNTTLPTTASGIIKSPQKQTVRFNKMLPNVGATYHLDDVNLVYASFAQGLSAPRTDDLYDIQLPDAKPEQTNSYDVGYRYQGGMVTGSAAGWYTKYKNRIVRAFDQDTNINITRNVGSVNLYGFDVELGVKPVEGLSLYTSASYVHSKVLNDIPLSATLSLPTAGKKLAETPEWTYSLRGEYTIMGLTIGAQGKYVAKRFSTDVNDEQTPAYTVVDLDIRYDFEDLLNWDGSYVQFNVINLFDKKYLGGISSRTNAIALPGSAAAAPTYTIGAPRTFMVSIRGKI